MRNGRFWCGVFVFVAFLAFGGAILGETHLDERGWTTWLDPAQVASVVDEFASSRTANDLEGRSMGGHAQFRIQWLKATAVSFDIRLLSDSMNMVALKRDRLNSDLRLIKTVEAKESSLVWQLALWHSGATAGLNPQVRALRSEAEAFVAEGNFQAAVPSAEKMVEAARAEHGDKHKFTGAALAFLATVYERCEDFDKALQAATQAHAIAVEVDDTQEVLSCQEIRARIFLALNSFSEARDINQWLLDHWRRQSNSINSSKVARLLSELSRIAVEEEEFAVAEQYLIEAIGTEENASQQNSIPLATYRHNLADLYRKIGDLDRAESELLKVKTLDEHNGVSQTTTATYNLRALGDIRMGKGDIDGARQYYEKSLAIASKAEQPPGLAVALSLNDLSNVEKGPQAKTRLKQSLAIYRKLFRGPHQEIATSLASLGTISIEAGDLKGAAQFLNEGLAVIDKLYDKRSHRRSYFLRWLALINREDKNLREARSLAEEDLRVQYSYWLTLSSIATERQRQAARATLQPFDLPATLEDGELLATTTLLLKGVVLDADLRDHRFGAAASADKVLSDKWTRIQAIRGRLRSRQLSEVLKVAQIDQTPSEEVELGKLERDFRTAGAMPSKPAISPDTAVQELQAGLPEKTVFVDFVRYLRWVKGSQSEERYAAAVISKKGNPKYVDFGSAQNLDKLVTEFRQLAGTPLAETATKPQIEKVDADLREISRELYDAFVVPINAATSGETTEVIVCPDSQLHFLCFYALMGPEDRFWGDIVKLSFVSTGRDLLASEDRNGSPHQTTAALFGQPAYDMPTYGTPHRDLSRAALRVNTSQGEVPELDGSGAEVADLEDMFNSFGWTCRAACGFDASETALRNVHHPTILHVATHGFFLPEVPVNAPLSTGVVLERLRNPMQRSGLLLAGASSTLREWRQHRRPEEDSDGILTADEVAGLDLQGTSLVTLSACKTALGDVPSGEGVLGLKRAFAVAGARNLIVTLWPISDQATSGVMKEFYGSVLSGSKPTDALRAAQHNTFARLRAERGLQHAINRAGAFLCLGR
jgi:CHAT domain-containing protein/tetratricopeptide (TPR) repeat protein